MQPTFDARYHLLDRTARRFGVPYPKHTMADDAYMMKHLWWFALIMVAEHPDESLVRVGRLRHSIAQQASPPSFDIHPSTYTLGCR